MLRRQRRRRNGDAVAVQSADVLSRRFIRVGCLGGALRGKLDHPARRARLRVESPSSTCRASFGACAFAPRCRSALCRPPGHWSACGSCGGLIGTGRELGGAAAGGHTAPGSPSGGSERANPSLAKGHPTGRAGCGRSPGQRFDRFGSPRSRHHGRTFRGDACGPRWLVYDRPGALFSFGVGRNIPSTHRRNPADVRQQATSRRYLPADPGGHIRLSGDDHGA